QPQALDRLLALRVTHDVAEDQLSLAPRVAGVDQTGNVLALEQLDEQLEAFFGALDRLEIEVRRDHRQIRERPLAALDLDTLGRNELEQMAYRRRKHVFAALVVITVARESPECAGDVVRHGRLLCDDELFCHEEAKTAMDRTTAVWSVLREAQNDKCNRNA